MSTRLDAIKRELSSLSHVGRVRFAYEVSRHLFPFYLDFVARKEWGNVAVFEHGLDLVQRFLHDGALDEQDRMRTIDECAKWIPNDNDFGGESGALCAGCAVAYAIEGCRESSSNEKAAAVAYCGFDLAISRATITEEFLHASIEQIQAAEDAAIVEEYHRQVEIISRIKMDSL